MNIRNITYRKRLALTYIVLAVLPLLVFIIVQYSLTQKLLKETIQIHSFKKFNMSLLYMSDLGEDIEEKSVDVTEDHLLVESIEAWCCDQCLEDNDNRQSDLLKNRLQLNIKRLISNHEYIRGLTVVVPCGESVGYGDEVSLEEIEKNGLSSINREDPLFLKWLPLENFNGGLIKTLYSEKSGKVIALLYFKIKNGIINSTQFSTQKLDCYIESSATHTPYYVFGEIDPSFIESNNIFDETKYSKQDIESGIFNYRSVYFRKEIRPGWNLVLEAKNSEVWQKLDRNLCYFAIICTILLGAVVVLSFILAKGYSSEIVLLVDEIGKAASGHSRFKFSQYHNVEVRDIASHIQVMHDHLRANITYVDDANIALEKKVVEKTALAQKYETLLSCNENLIKELHHRTKNNMQIITSLLYLQTTRVAENSEVLKILEEAITKIHGMALVHQMLYQASDLSILSIKEYYESLIALILDFKSHLSAELEVTLDLDEVSLNIDTLIPCGLILNELVANTFEHAFLNGAGKKAISVSCKQVDNRCIITYLDNGVGISKDQGIEKLQTLGMLTIIQLSEYQLGGTFAIDYEYPGFFCTISFEISDVLRV